VLPGSAQFSASVTAAGTAISVSNQDIPFSVLSPNIEWSCEENKTQTASFTLPSGATLLSQDADWGEIAGRYENHGCSVATAGTSVIASCSVRGGNKDCALFCNCPGGGNGKARVFGTYRVQNSTPTPFTDRPIQTFLLSSKVDGSSFITLPQHPDSTYSTVNYNIYRANKQSSCSTVYDSITINLPAPINPGATLVQSTTQTSSKGEFEATADQNQVSVKRISAPN
jgi:hypothetical protein